MKRGSREDHGKILTLSGGLGMHLNEKCQFGKISTSLPCQADTSSNGEQAQKQRGEQEWIVVFFFFNLPKYWALTVAPRTEIFFEDVRKIYTL